MNRKDIWKKAGVLACMLTLLLAVSQFAASWVLAADAIDTERKCSVTFKLENAEAEYTELAGLEIPVELYRVADISATGKYTAREGFEGLDISAVTADTSAVQWQEMADQAVGVVKEKNLDADAQTVLHREGSQGKVEGLSAGMYLVTAQTVQTPEYSYAFAPYLLSLPNNYYYQTKDDTWVYDASSELKPDQTNRYGDLEITKQLSSYNMSLGTACFVFQVEAVRNGQSVYSNVFALNFDAPGTKKILAEDIPAGAQVTVTEVYSGASYESSAEKEQKTVIIAEGENGSPARVSFQNEYNGRRNTSSGIVNHFVYNEGTWDVEQQ